MVKNVRAQCGIITREAGPAEGGATAIAAFVKEPNMATNSNYSRYNPLLNHFPESGPSKTRLDGRDGARHYLSDARLALKNFLQYTIGMVGYDDDQYVTIVLKVVISTDDVYKSALVVNLVSQELGGKITRRPGPVSPRMNTKITSFLDTDGWKIVIFFRY
ncbi:hypothetical protein RHMOL_Rhmol13G0202300 [Rhododendron molle]|uniref:Uncharacterized protein n=1 Tax=Rhododendron molle TaxID=49168 RepID=A0ACC0L9Q5_RHOML|nr:hypothetical protein RHMOL_Rhmol13G0202300 [Rhododendron molle]